MQRLAKLRWLNRCQVANGLKSGNFLKRQIMCQQCTLRLGRVFLEKQVEIPKMSCERKCEGLQLD